MRGQHGDGHGGRVLRLLPVPTVHPPGSQAAARVQRAPRARGGDGLEQPTGRARRADDAVEVGDSRRGVDSFRV